MSANVDAIKKKIQDMKEKRARINAAETTKEETTQRNPNNALKMRQEKMIQDRSFSLTIQPEPRPATYEIDIQCDLEPRANSVEPQKSIRKESEDDLGLLQPKERKQRRDERADAQNAKPIKFLNEQERTSLEKSKPFFDFFNHSTKLIEKILDNPTRDNDMLEVMLQEGLKPGANACKDILTPLVKFSDPHYTRNRVVTSVDWSPQIPELVLASYSQNEEGNIKDHVGVLLLWSLGLRTRPQFHCFCQSSITSACFYPFSNNLIIGGCYNGQLLLWDFRTKSPVQRTGVSSNGHKFPVYSINVVGTQITNNIVSFSNDGKLCTWDIKSFKEPLKVTKYEKGTGTASATQMNATCCEFPQGDVNNFYFGTENGPLYRSSLHSGQVADSVMYEGHNAPITSISVNNPSSEYSALSGLILSSSFDWSVKLWSPKQKECIRTFQYSDDYIFDVDWNPSNPALFSTVNNQGYIDLWDLTADLEIPILHQRVDKYAINKCKWNREGSKIMTGDSQGVVNVFDLEKKYQKLEGGRMDDLESLLVESRDA